MSYFGDNFIRGHWVQFNDRAWWTIFEEYEDIDTGGLEPGISHRFRIIGYEIVAED